MNNPLTIVSGYWKIKNKHENNFEQWFNNTLSINCPYVFFSDKETIEIIKTYRKELPTYYIECNIEDFHTYKYKDKMITDKFHCPSVELNLIWNEKAFLVKKALKINPFNSEYFCWVDAGICTYRDNKPPNKLFPNIEELNKLPKDKLIYSSSIMKTYNDKFMKFSKSNPKNGEIYNIPWLKISSEKGKFSNDENKINKYTVEEETKKEFEKNHIQKQNTNDMTECCSIISSNVSINQNNIKNINNCYLKTISGKSQKSRENDSNYLNNEKVHIEKNQKEIHSKIDKTKNILMDFDLYLNFYGLFKEQLYNDKTFITNTCVENNVTQESKFKILIEIKKIDIFNYYYHLDKKNKSQIKELNEKNCFCNFAYFKIINDLNLNIKNFKNVIRLNLNNQNDFKNENDRNSENMFVIY